jgi:general secretion pathway protein L
MRVLFWRRVEPKGLCFMTSIGAVLSRFFAWWFAELGGCLPAGLRNRLRRRQRTLAITVAEDTAGLSLRNGEGQRELGRIAFDADNAPATRRAFAAAVRGLRLRAVDVVVELPAMQVLRRIVDLPSAAAENLREVLSFELDRHTPFKVDEVAFDYRITGFDATAKRIAVDLAVVPRPVVERARSLAAACGVAPVRVGVAGDNIGAAKPMNFLQPTNSAQREGSARRLSIVLGMCAVALLITAIYLPLYHTRQIVADLEARLAKSHAAAMEADALKQKVAAALERTRFLVDRRLSTPTMAALLNEVTLRLPDGTWLVGLHIEEDQLYVSGFSPAAASLIAGLEDSPLLSEVRFSSPVTTDPRVGIERFNLGAAVAPVPGL